MFLLAILPPFFCSVLGSFSEAENSTVSSINGKAECVLAKRTAQTAVPGLCEAYQAVFPSGYCKEIIGYLPVYGRNPFKLKVNEMKLLGFLKFLERSRGNSTELGVKMIVKDKSYVLRNSCLDAIDDVYCHHYFKRCYISSEPQLLCRETCEELLFRVCDQEINMVKKLRLKFGIIDCTTLPFRNESSSCYYPDKIRDKLALLKSEDCFYEDGRGYRGNRNVTVSGYTCQSWNAQCPHQHNISGTIYKSIKNSGNVCRNPGGFATNGPWCFTTNRTVRWEYCDVPKCAKRPPASSPVSFRGHNTSSKSIKLTWGDVPKDLIHGILLGFQVACKRVGNMSDRHFEDLAPTNHAWKLSGLEKYRNYSCQLRAYNNFGMGNWSEKLVISTNEDAPDRPPTNITTQSLESDAIQVSWNPVPSEHTNGKVLGYNVFYNEVKDLSSGNITVALAKEACLKIEGLKANTNYSFQVLAFTAKGNGPKSKAYFAKTLSGQTVRMRKPDLSSGKSQSTKVSTVVAATLSGTVALGALCFAIYFVRKRRISSLVNNETDSNDSLAPNANSSSDGAQMASTIFQAHDMFDNVPATTHRPRCIYNTAEESVMLL